MGSSLLQRVVRKEPTLTVGDLVFLAVMLVAAAGFTAIGVVGVVNHHDDVRLLVLAMFALLLASCAAYLAIAAAVLWLLESIKGGNASDVSKRE